VLVDGEHRIGSLIVRQNVPWLFAARRDKRRLTMPLGGMISLLALAPNVIWAFLPSHDTPARSPAPAGRVARVLALVEPVGRVAVFATPFFYSIGSVSSPAPAGPARGRKISRTPNAW